MSSRPGNRFVSAGAAAALSGALMFGLAGTAAAAPAGSAVGPTLSSAAVSTPVDLASFERGRNCHREWHGGSWSWRDEGNWERGHHWQHRRSHHWRPGWWSWSCR
jgi:hypothetical protein